MAADEIASIRLVADAAAAIGLVRALLGNDVETRSAGQGDENAAIIGLAIGGETAGAAGLAQESGLVERRFLALGRAARLDDADDAVAGENIVEHLQIARLENIQRQGRARQQDASLQRKDRNGVRKIARLPIAVGHAQTLSPRGITAKAAVPVFAR